VIAVMFQTSVRQK